MRSSARRAQVMPASRRSYLTPVVLSIGFLMGFPSVAAYQDITSYIAGEQSETRWAAVIERSVAGSVHQAEMPLSDQMERLQSISGSGISAPGIGEVAFRSEKRTIATSPDEDRINRSEKQGRVINSVPMAPPQMFNAGSIVEQTGAFLDPSLKAESPMQFIKPQIKGKEVQIATAFHAKQKAKKTDAMLPVVARLVNNNDSDILATAYAPIAPDYEKASPFASILREKGGRFIPPVDDDDHSWAKYPLPAAVFSSKEQQCLAEAVYFEARGELVKGQAAVAQVVLNRVRNPAYPSTVCGVVYQNNDWRNRCQFSFACDGTKPRVNSPAHYEIAKEVAMAVTAGKIWLDEVGSSTHYHADYVRPKWASSMKRLAKIGQHIFYRTYGGGWN